MKLTPHLNLEYLTGVAHSVFLNDDYSNAVGHYIDDFKVSFNVDTQVLEITAYDDENDGYPKSIWVNGIDVDRLYTMIHNAFEDLYNEIRLVEK